MNQQKQTTKEKLIKIRDKIKYPILFILAMLPTLTILQNYYSLNFPLMNLWDVFVEQLFGSFWIAVAFISIFFFIILMLGGISYFTVVIFMMYFLLAMTIGYGYPLIPAALATFGTVYFLFQGFKWLDNR
jgi:hypothetical protein